MEKMEKENLMKRINFLSNELKQRQVKLEKELESLEKICIELMDLESKLEENVE